MTNKLIKKVPIHIITAAKEAALESDCNRLNVGAVIWGWDNSIISSGCNRAPHNSKYNCKSNGHLIVEGHCIRTVHAETVAICSNLVYTGLKLLMHVTHTPCSHCIKMIIETGIIQLSWGIDYGNAAGALTVLNESQLYWGRV